MPIRREYHATIVSLLIFIKDLALAAFGQMASLFAGIFFFGLLINLFSQLTFKSLENAFGRGGVYFVAWLGTPVHELAHALFCVIFWHKVVEIEFFKPNPQTGTLGYVYHRWNRANPWQVLGNLFIGIGPIIIGCAVLFALFYFLIPGSSRVWDSVSAQMKELAGSYSIGSYLSVFKDSSLAMIKLIFTPENLAGWRFWVFCYLSICVASNMRLSLADIKGSLSGFGCVILLFVFINLAGLITGLGSERVFPFAASFLGAIYSLFILALIMAVIGFFLTYTVSATFVKLRRGYLLKPF